LYYADDKLSQRFDEWNSPTSDSVGNLDLRHPAAAGAWNYKLENSPADQTAAGGNQNRPPDPRCSRSGKSTVNQSALSPDDGEMKGNCCESAQSACDQRHGKDTMCFRRNQPQKEPKQYQV
jgi:hypothetical protein